HTALGRASLLSLPRPFFLSLPWASRPRPDLVRHPDRGGGGDRIDQPASRHESVRDQRTVAAGADAHAVPRRHPIHDRRRGAAWDLDRLSSDLAVAAKPDAVSQHFFDSIDPQLT